MIAGVQVVSIRSGVIVRVRVEGGMLAEVPPAPDMNVYMLSQLLSNYHIIIKLYY